MLIAFIVMPLIEIAVLIQVGSWLGLWPTLGLIILTAIIGTWMLRRQGFAVLSRAQRQLEEGGIPLGEVFEGFCLVIAGALLLTPGFVTDVIGGSLLAPPVRAWLYRALGGRFRAAAMPGGGRQPPPSGAQPPPGQSQKGRGPVVEGDYETIDDRDGRDQGGASGPMPPPRGSWDDKP